MNPQQLRQLIHQHLEIGQALASAEADGRSSTSLAAVTRRIANQLESLRASVSPPHQPLPSAECLAAFVENQSTMTEEQQVVASCIHDMGMLFQLVNLFDQQCTHACDPVSASVMTRLLALAPVSAKSNSDSAMQPDDQAATPQASIKSIANSTASSAARVKPDAVIRPGTSKLFWAAAVVLAASAMIVAIGSRYLMKSDSAPDPKHRSISGNDPSEPSAPETIESPLHQSMDHQIAEEKSTETLPPETPQQVVVNPPDQPLLSPPLNTPLIPPQNAPSASPMEPSQIQSVVSDIRFGHWERVIGVVAASAERDYPVWQAVTESDHKELVDKDSTLSWITPPGCFAQTSFGDQSRLTLRENSLASFRSHRDLSQDLPVCKLEYGSVHISESLTKRALQLETNSTAPVRLNLEQNASLVAWIEANNLRVLTQGEVRANGNLLFHGKVFQITANGLELLDDIAEIPAWCKQLPKESLLSKTILANIDSSRDLAKSVDQQLMRLLSRPANNPQSLKLIQQLSQWRVALEIDAPLRAAVSPLTPVRIALFNALFAPTTEQRFVTAKRDLLGRLQTSEARRRQQIAHLQLQPTRQDLAAWLNELTGDDPELAGLADFMFRSQGRAGPEFDPTAPRVQREASKQEWLKVITGR